jgi:hypothetical protein
MQKEKSPTFPPAIKAYFAEMGRQGGLKGGQVRSQKLTPERRSEIARHAIAVRWAKKKQGAV